MKQNPPIFGFNAAKSDIVHEVADRVVESEQDPLFSLNDAAYFEIKRLESSRRKKDQEKLGEWQRLARAIGRMSKGERTEKLRELVEEYAWDVAGNFDPRVYKISTRVLPGLVTALLAPRTLTTFVKHPRDLMSLDALQDKVLIEGPIEKLQSVAEKGVCVFVPRSNARGFRPPPTALARISSPIRSSRTSCTTSAPTASTDASSTRSTRTS